LAAVMGSAERGPSKPGTSVERACSLLVGYSTASASQAAITSALAEGDDAAKADALRKVIALMLEGEQMSSVFITVVRYVLPSEDHTVQKLLLLYLELVDRIDASGTVLPEMILICQTLRNLLQHANEFVRGVTLRFLCRLHEPELLEPLVPSVLQNLEHRIPYVRRNAVLAVDAISRLPNGDALLSDAVDSVEKVLSNDNDVVVKRNALVMLTNADPDRALRFLRNNLKHILSWHESLQTASLELVRKAVRRDPSFKGQYLNIVLNMLSSQNTNVLFESASTLVFLSSAPTAVKSAVKSFCNVLTTSSDNNVKLVVLGRLEELKRKHPSVMEEMLMDVMQALSAPSIEIKRKTLQVAMELMTSKNVDDLAAALRKEMLKIRANEFDQVAEFSQLLIHSLHTCALRFPHITSYVTLQLVDFVGDDTESVAQGVAQFVREALEVNEELRPQLLERLCDMLNFVQSSSVCSTVLWILGEYSDTRAEVNGALSAIKASLGTPPFHRHGRDSNQAAQDDAVADDTSDGAASSVATANPSVRPVVLADGTYASQSAVAESKDAGGAKLDLECKLRTMVQAGDFYLCSVVATTLTKLALRLRSLNSETAQALNKEVAENMLYMASMERLGEANEGPKPIDDDSSDHIRLCINILAAPEKELEDTMLVETRSAFTRMMQSMQSVSLLKQETEQQEQHSTQADDLIDFEQLKGGQGSAQMDVEEEVSADVERASGFQVASDTASQRTVQLTGSSDSVLAEALVTVHQYDIVLDISVLNKTNETLQNMSVELQTKGDLKVIERPQSFTIEPGGERNIRANVKVASTETGMIFGYIVYTIGGGQTYASRCTRHALH